MTRRVLIAAVACVAGIQLWATGSAAAAGPQLRLYVQANTTSAPGEQFQYQIDVLNIGDANTSGDIHLNVELPPGITAVEGPNGSGFGGFDWNCSGLTPGASTVDCTLADSDPPNTQLYPRSMHFVVSDRSLLLTVAADPTAMGAKLARFEVSGGGAPPVSTVNTVEITSTPPFFGIAAFDAPVTAGPAPAAQPFPDSFENPANFPAASTQAGGHAYATGNTIMFNTFTNPNPLLGMPWPVEPARNILVDLPPGLIGNPNATGGARCTALDLAHTESLSITPLCPAASQVGVATVFTSGGGIVVGDPLPLFNMVPPLGIPARFGMNVFGTVVVLDAEVRSGTDYGISVNVRNVSEGLALAGSSLTFWGLPADPAHDGERSCPGEEAPWVHGPTCSSEAPHFAFLRNPTSCTPAGTGLSTTLHTDSWFDPGATLPGGAPDLSDPRWHSATYVSHEPPGFPLPSSSWGDPVGIDHCAEVPFEPSISVTPTTGRADSPTGLTVDLTIPQEGLSDPLALAQSDLKDAIVKLPAGMSVNPAQANGLGGCTSDQIDLHGENTQPSCPDSSKIGTIELTTPLLDHPIEGAVYLAAQQDNPFKSLLALYLVADDKVQTGTVIKLAGEVKANPDTGQLETIFTNQPQLPFESLHLELFSGAQAPLITPPHCGSYATTATMTPWSGNAAAELSSSFEVTSGPAGSPCPPKPAPFAPKLSAGTQSPIAGTFSPFVLRLTREDGTQRLSGLNVTLPKGLIGKPAGIPYCPESALASLSAALGTGAAQLPSPACPAASQVGTVTVGAGAGPSPFYVQTGRAYLAGPYKGAPLSLAIATPALAGPFDLGNVLVRTALQVNPESAQITAVSDLLPTILHGIPLDLRDVRVNLDRPGFTLNPTSCDPMAIETTVSGTEGATANPSSRFQVGECARLGFKPKLSIKLKGGTKRSEFPALRATLKARAGDANIAKAVVSLPHSEFLAQSHIRTICTRVQFAADKCPKGSIYGHASAITPLLDKPLSGPVYLRSSSNPLPDLVVALKGQIEVDLVGRIDSKGGGIRTTFASVPDAPVSKFVLTMKGGRKGLLENSRDLCRSRNRASVLMDGQNGKVADSRVVVGARCGEGRKRARG